MSERKKVPQQVVRAILLREEPLLNNRQSKFPQTLLTVRPGNGNEGADENQAVGGRYYEDEQYQLDKAIARVVREEIGVSGLTFTQVAREFSYGGWRSHVFYSWLTVEQSESMKVDLKRNKGYQWVDTDGTQAITERRNKEGKLIYYLTIAFDHPEMIQEVLRLIRT